MKLLLLIAPLIIFMFTTVHAGIQLSSTTTPTTGTVATVKKRFLKKKINSTTGSVTGIVHTNLEIITSMGYYSTGYIPTTGALTGTIPYLSFLEMSRSSLIQMDKNHKQQMEEFLYTINSSIEINDNNRKDVEKEINRQVGILELKYSRKREKQMKIYTKRYNLCIKN